MIKQLDNKTRILMEIIIFSLFISIISTSWAYFTIMVNGSGNKNIVQTGSMMLSYEDGPAVYKENFLPGESITKTFKIKNIGTLKASYDIYFSELINTFEDKTDLVYTLTSTNGCQILNEVTVPSTSGEKLVNQCDIEKNQEHTYTLKILFKETEENQNSNMGASFSAKISVNDYNESSLAYVNESVIESKTLAKVNEIRNTPNTDVSSRSGSIYYVSGDGNDSNNGLSENSPFKTLEEVNTRVKNGEISSGSTILLRDGDTFRGYIDSLPADTLIGSYGDISKGKPTINRSTYDGAKEGNWVEVKPNIWKYTYNDNDQVFNVSVGTIWMFCESGNNNCSKSMTTVDKKFEYASMITTNSNYDETDLENKIDTILTNDLEFYHANHPYDKKDIGGALYLYSIENPATRFDEIEFSEGKNGITSRTNDLRVDNIRLLFVGRHGISSSSINNFVVTNSEIGFTGGSIQSYDASTGKAVRFGNAIEIWGSIEKINGKDVTDGFLVDNNYIYQSYDAGPTFQYTTDKGYAHVEKARFSNNVIEYSNYNIEYWTYTKETSGNNYDYSYIKDFVIDNNILRYAGYGLCETRLEKKQAAHIKTWGTGAEAGARNHIKGQIKISNNIFYKHLDYAYIWRSNSNNYPVLVNNKFYANKDSLFGIDSHEELMPEIGFNESKLSLYYPSNKFVILDKNELNIMDDSGTTGDLNWNYNSSTYTLTISGTGDMANYSLEEAAPWYKYKDYIYTIIIGENVKSLGKYAFYEHEYVSTLRIDAIELSNLSNSSENINYGDNYTFYNLGTKSKGTELIFGENISSIPAYLMNPNPGYNKASRVTKVKFEGNNIKTIGNYGIAFYAGYGIALPEGVTKAEGLSLGYGDQRVIILPNSLKVPGDWTMSSNNNLERIVFGPVVSFFHEHTFSGNKKLSEVVIPHLNNTTTVRKSLFDSVTNTVTVYGDESTQTWVNNQISTYNSNIVYKPLSEYKSKIISNSGINEQVGYASSYTFNATGNVKAYYTYFDSNNNKHLFSEIKLEKNGNTYTINNIKSDIYIEIK